MDLKNAVAVCLISLCSATLVLLIARALGITLDWRWLGSAEIGVSAERDTDGGWVAGPSLSLELPIFDQHQADIARLEAQLRQSQKRIYALAVDIYEPMMSRPVPPF